MFTPPATGDLYKKIFSDSEGVTYSMLFLPFSLLIVEFGGGNTCRLCVILRSDLV